MAPRICRNRRQSRFETLEPRHVLATWFVATDGNDLQLTGSFEQPFKTISRAADFAQAGDTVFIRGGVYRDPAAVVDNSGADGAPITFTAFNDEEVVLSGGDLITGWTPVAGMTDVWVATVNFNANNNRAANTLFVDGELKFEAREHAENDPLDIDNWGQVPQGSLTSTTLTASDLTGWGDDFWNGAQVRHHTNDFTVINSVIADYVSSIGRITFEDSAGLITQKQTTGYYIFDTLGALDQPGEWYKGKAEDGPGEQNRLYYKAEPGQDPNSLEIEFKNRAFGFDVRGKDYINIEGITFRGVSIQTDGDTDNNTYSGNLFYAYDKANYGRLFITGDNNVFRDNEVRQLWGSIITFDGVRNEFVNNLVVDTGYNGVAKGLIATGAEEMLISHNTIRSFAEAFMDGYPLRSEISHNVFEDGGKLTFDTGVFDSDGGNGNQSFSIFHHNIFRDTQSRGIYEGFYGRNDNAVIHHNLFYDFDGDNRTVLRAGGTDFRQVFHNTVITDVSGAPSGTLDARAAIQTRYSNNVQITIERMEALGVEALGNYNYSTSDFVDFFGDDFRLAGGSAAIDTGIVIPGINDGFLGSAPDPGAFEFGAAAWEAGHDFVTPPNPVYSWQPIAGSNLNLNPQFNQGISDWTVTSGSPNSQDRNSFNLGPSGASLTGTFRTQSVELTPGESIRRVFADLAPNSTYTLGVGARVANELNDADEFNGSSGTIGTGEHRGVGYVTGLSAGEWVRYDSIDFGDAGQFDQLDLLHIRDPATFPANVDGVTVQVRLDAAAGPVIAEFSDLLDGSQVDRWRADRADLVGTLSGVHSLYVSVTGANSQNLALGNFRLLKQSPPTSDLLSVTIESTGANQVSAQVGAEDWEAGYEEITFTTGPAETTAQVSVANNGRLNAYLDRVYLIEGAETRGADPRDISSGAAAQRSLTASTSASAPGVTDGVLGNDTVTGDHSGSWVQVDLGRTETIHSIKLSPSASQPSRLSNFRLSVWDADPRAGGTELWSQDYLTDGVSLAADESLFVQGDSRALDGDLRLASVAGRFVRVQLLGPNNSGDEQLALGELQVFGFDESNLAVTDGAASQSTTESGGGAANAIDGDPATSSATQTSDTDSWWQVRFPQAFSIGQIDLVNPGAAGANDLSNFTVSVWDEDPAAGGVKLWEKSYFSTGGVVPGATFSIDGSEIGDGSTRRLASNHTGRVVRVQLDGTNNAGNGRLALAEVRVAMSDADAPELNIAQRGVAEQSNDFYGDAAATGTGRGFADVANDGVILPAVNFTSALSEPGAWWQVDLQQEAAIEQIVVFNRIDAASRLNNFTVSVWDNDPDAGGTELWDRTYFYSGGAPDYSTSSIGPGGSLTIDGNVTSGGLRLDEVAGGRFVRVQLNGTNILSLPEVQVWSEAPAVEPGILTVTIDPVTGRAVLSNQSGEAVVIDGYTIADSGSGLLTDDWFSLEDQSYDGGVWFEAAPTPGRVSELNGSDGSTVFAPGANVYLGELVNPSLVGLVDFDYLLAGDSELVSGLVVLAPLAIPSLPGDYNLDGTVTASDFTLWRDQLGGQALPFAGADGNGSGSIDVSDYLLWRSQFGKTSAPAALTGASQDNREPTGDSGSGSSISEPDAFAAPPVLAAENEAPATPMTLAPDALERAVQLADPDLLFFATHYAIADETEDGLTAGQGTGDDEAGEDLVRWLDDAFVSFGSDL